MKLYQKLSELLAAIGNCVKTGNTSWEHIHSETLEKLVKEHLPSGSGFDTGTTLNSASTPEKLIFTTEFHHMNETGYYDGWTTHRITVKPSLQFDFVLDITGPDKNDIKSYIHEVFHNALETELSE